MKVYLSEYYRKNKESMNARMRWYYGEHKEELKQRNAQWAKDHPERMNEFKKKYVEKNPEKVKAAKKRHRTESIVYKITHTLRSRLSSVFKGRVRSGSAVRDLGCTPNQLMVHLEKQFKPGMTWENYGFRGWHIDHIKPLASFDLMDLEQLRRAVHYTNLQPLWAVENQRKHAKVL
jgi:hypothetical protein